MTKGEASQTLRNGRTRSLNRVDRVPKQVKRVEVTKNPKIGPRFGAREVGYGPFGQLSKLRLDFAQSGTRASASHPDAQSRVTGFALTVTCHFVCVDTAAVYSSRRTRETPRGRPAPPSVRNPQNGSRREKQARLVMTTPDEQQQQPWRPLEKTFAMIKPDAVLAGSVSAILKRAEDAGFVVVVAKETVLSPRLAGEFYAEHRGTVFFDALVHFATSGPVVCLCLAKSDAIEDWRVLMGPSDTLTAKQEAPLSLRARFGTDGTRNATHGSNSLTSATRELKFFFPNAILDPVPTNGDARKYIKENLTPTLIKGLAALCKTKPSAKPLEAVQWLAGWLRENNPTSANAFAEKDFAIDHIIANEDANDFETVPEEINAADSADVTDALDDLETQMKAAVTVQNHFRGHQARANASRDRKDALGGSGSVTIVLESHGDANEEHAAASKLQASYRGFSVRKEQAQLRESESAAATKMQSGFRGHQARREAQALRLERETLANAATKVQAGFRGHQARKELAAMKGGEGESATEGETGAETEEGTLETESETGAETETTA